MPGPGLSKTTQAWRGFWRQDAGSRGVLLEATAANVATRLGLRVLGYSRWKALLIRCAPGPKVPAGNDIDTVKAARELARLQQAVARQLSFKANCLEQSLALWWLLRRRGISAELRVGARKAGGTFEAHAWVEVRGIVLNDLTEEHRDFAPFNGPIIPADRPPQ